MTDKEFITKHHIDLDRRQGLELFFALDTLYCEYTLQQALDMVKDYYEHADEIYNSTYQNVKEGIDYLAKLVDKKEK